MIKITLTKIFPQEAKISKNKIKTRWCIFFFISLLYIIIVIGRSLILYLIPDFDIGYLLNPIFIGSRLFKVAMDTFIEILFISLLVFFMKYRKEYGSKRTFTFNNYLVLITILLLYSLSVLQSVLAFAWAFENITKPNESS
jgi:hypothetical protein